MKGSEGKFEVPPTYKMYHDKLRHINGRKIIYLSLLIYKLESLKIKRLVINLNACFTNSIDVIT